MNTQWDTDYCSLMNSMLVFGFEQEERTGTGMRSISFPDATIDLQYGNLPVLSTKKMNPMAPITEMLWFMKGHTDIEWLKRHNINIWDEWVLHGTDKWREPKPCESMTAGDVINWARLRCPTLWDVYKPWIKEHSSAPRKERADWLRAKAAEFGITIPDLKLVGGSIGNSAYGTQWRKWDDTRVIINDVRNRAEARKALAQINAGLNPQDGYYLVDVLASGGMVIQRKIDQLARIIDTLVHNPNSRRILHSGWNVAELEEMALPCCHFSYQVHSYIDPHTNERTLSMVLNCRSQDFALGTPYNVLQYAALAHILAFYTGHKTNKLKWNGGIAHLYENHLELAEEQMERIPKKIEPKLEFAHDVFNRQVKKRLYAVEENLEHARFAPRSREFFKSMRINNDQDVALWSGRMLGRDAESFRRMCNELGVDYTYDDFDVRPKPWDLEVSDLRVLGYDDPHPAIPYEVAI